MLQMRPPRVLTTLLPLKPYGISTPQVEGLRSYCGRICLAHCLDQRALFNFLFAHGLPRAKNVWKYGVQGPNEHSIKIAKILADGTEQHLVARLTLASLNAHFHFCGLQEDCENRRYCPYCYSEMWEQYGEVFDPLVWGVVDVNVCPLHRVFLQKGCPDCKSRGVGERRLLAPFDRCEYCGKRLDREGFRNRNIQVPNDTMGNWNIWFATQISLLIDLAVSRPEQIHRDFLQAFSSHIGNIGAHRILDYTGPQTYSHFGSLLARSISPRTGVDVPYFLDVCAFLGLDPPRVMCTPDEELRAGRLFGISECPLASKLEKEIFERARSAHRDKTNVRGVELLAESLEKRLLRLIEHRITESGVRDSLVSEALRMVVKSAIIGDSLHGRQLAIALMSELDCEPADANILVGLLEDADLSSVVVPVGITR